MTAVVVMLSASEAQRLTQRIKLTASGVRDGLFKLRNLVDEAKRSNVWQILGFPSWTAYLADTLADEPMRLGREERQELVGYLSGEGLSTRAIAPIVGVDNKTVHRDIARVANATPDPEAEVDADPATGEVIEPAVEDVHDAATSPPAAVAVRVEAPQPPRSVTGLDGKTYPVEPSKPRAEAVTSRFTAAVADLNRVMARLRRIAEDKNFPRNRDQVAALHGNDLVRTISELETLANALKGL